MTGARQAGRQTDRRTLRQAGRRETDKPAGRQAGRRLSLGSRANDRGRTDAVNCSPSPDRARDDRRSRSRDHDKENDREKNEEQEPMDTGKPDKEDNDD